MQIKEIRILPPIAIGRLGASPLPVAAYDLVIPDNKPLDFRQIIPQETLTVDNIQNTVSAHVPDQIVFKDPPESDGYICPVAPFLELFAITSDNPDMLVPLTEELLQQAGLTLDNVSWSVTVGNLKLFRRTGNIKDKIIATVENIKDAYVYKLVGECPNFHDGKTLPLGSVQFIRPSNDFPGLRFRFTPAAGNVYGSSTERIESEGAQATADPVITSDLQVLYDPAKGGWQGYSETAKFNPTYTMPAQIFAGYSTKHGDQVSWGYLDDECDGIVTATLQPADNGLAPLSATAHIVAGPPAFAPDILPIRAVSDELEQIIMGTAPDKEVPIEVAEEIVRRAFESITLMNTAVMNGNPINGRENVASTMVRQDTNDFGRLYEPIMASSIVDNLALRTLHERVFNGLSSGAATWFASALRKPHKIGDLSDTERRKMPGLMRGADGRALTLTHRMINSVIQAASNAMFRTGNTATPPPAPPPPPPVPGQPLKADELIAQLHYRGLGNPYSVLPRTAISNCFPGLEFDFRNLWRHTFQNVTMSENDNYVLNDTTSFNLTGRRLVAVNGQPTMVRGIGPVFPGGDNVHLTTSDNPSGAAFMEWSNLIAGFKLTPGQTVQAQFTAGEATLPVLVTADELSDKVKYPEFTLTVNSYMTPNTAALSPTIVAPGELTHGLCAPWQNDYRECACYYWAASRPDYVNVEPGEDGLSHGDMWLAKRRTGEYVPDNRTDSRLFSYDDLFQDWQGELSFIINGRDAVASPSTSGDGGGQSSDKAAQPGTQVHPNPSLIDK
ncbi:hypothetical protein [Chitinophaga sp. CF418]|uniref:hypothetical protein n=1 Tax=Chitinophaga sp. CF418 TaxID=1855287 RepID=UPI0009176AC0|nr:hypothetical protein [Chitinophaga sp. CF418]SHN15828.1 hypothetical protein SAMN05216311_10620 [Chitinophaga sp. CF418]